MDQWKEDWFCNLKKISYSSSKGTFGVDSRRSSVALFLRQAGGKTARRWAFDRAALLVAAVGRAAALVAAVGLLRNLRLWLAFLKVASQVCCWSEEQRVLDFHHSCHDSR